MRPLGSLVIGSYSDRHGRKNAILLNKVPVYTKHLYQVANMIIGVSPDYGTYVPTYKDYQL